MVKIKHAEKKEEASEKKSIIVNLQRAKVEKWEEYDPSKKYRRCWLLIPVTVWDNPKDVDKQLPEGTWIKNVNVRINLEKSFFNLLECEVEEKQEGGESGSEIKEQTDSPPLFFTIMKCPKCEEKIEWIRPEAKEVFDRLIYYILQAEVLLGLRKNLPVKVEING